jgi:hypothetical protein
LTVGFLSCKHRSMIESSTNPWPKLDRRTAIGETYLKGSVIMRVLKKDEEGGRIRFVSTPDNQPIITAEIAEIANDR